MATNSNKKTIEKNSIKQVGGVKMWQPVLGCRFNYATGLSDGNIPEKKRDDNKYTIVINRFQYNT